MQLTITGISGIPEVRPGDDLAGLVLAGCTATGVDLREGDVLVVTQKVVSKAEGRLVDLRQVEPSAFALDYAKRWGKDPRQIEVVLRESVRVVRRSLQESWTDQVARAADLLARKGVNA